MINSSTFAQESQEQPSHLVFYSDEQYILFMEVHYSSKVFVFDEFSTLSKGDIDELTKSTIEIQPNSVITKVVTELRDSSLCSVQVYFQNSNGETSERFVKTLQYSELEGDEEICTYENPSNLKIASFIVEKEFRISKFEVLFHQENQPTISEENSLIELQDNSQLKVTDFQPTNPQPQQAHYSQTSSPQKDQFLSQEPEEAKNSLQVVEFNQSQIQSQSVEVEVKKNSTKQNLEIIYHTTHNAVDAFIKFQKFSDSIPKRGVIKNAEAKQHFENLDNLIDKIFTNKSEIGTLLQNGWRQLVSIKDNFEDLFSKLSPFFKKEHKGEMPDLDSFKEDIKEFKGCLKKTKELLELITAKKSTLELLLQDKALREINKMILGESTVMDYQKFLKDSSQEMTTFKVKWNEESKLKEQTESDLFDATAQISQLKSFIGSTQVQIDLFQSTIKDIEQKTSNVQSMILSKNQDNIENSKQVSGQNTLEILNNEYESTRKSTVVQYEEQVMALKRMIQVEQQQMQSSDSQKFQKIHIIKVYDKSGSMEEHWPSLEGADTATMSVFKSSDSQHLFSVIYFDDKAQIISKKQKVNEVEKLPKPKYMGGTNFEKGIEAIQDIIQLTPDDYMPMIIFLTDGAGRRGKAIPMIEEMKVKYPNLLVFCIGFGDTFDRDFLKQLCKAGNKSDTLSIRKEKFDFVAEASDANSLGRVFKQIFELFESSPSENRIKALQKQIDEGQERLDKSLKALDENYALQRTSAQERAAQMKEISALSLKEDEQSLKELVDKNLQNYTKKLTEAFDTQKANQAKLADQEARFNGLTARKQIQIQAIKLISDKIESIRQQENKKADERDKFFEDSYEMTGFLRKEQFIEFEKEIKSVKSVVENLKILTSEVEITYDRINSDMRKMVNLLDKTFSSKGFKSNDPELIQVLKKKFMKKIEGLKDQKDDQAIIKAVIAFNIKEKEFRRIEPYFDRLKVYMSFYEIAILDKDKFDDLVKKYTKKLMPVKRKAIGDNAIAKAKRKGSNSSDGSDSSEEEEQDASQDSETSSQSSGSDSDSDKQKKASTIKQQIAKPVEQSVATAVDNGVYETESKDIYELTFIDQVEARITFLNSLLQDLATKKKETKKKKKDLGKDEYKKAKKDLKSKLVTRTQERDFFSELLEDKVAYNRVEELFALIKKLLQKPLSKLKTQKSFDELHRFVKKYITRTLPSLMDFEKTTKVFSIVEPEGLQRVMLAIQHTEEKKLAKRKKIKSQQKESGQAMITEK